MVEGRGRCVDTPSEDLREVYHNDDEEIDMNVPEHDARFILNMGGELVPWTFDEVSFSQRLRCRVGLHRGRAEVVGGEVCFYCSYCGAKSSLSTRSEGRNEQSR